MRKLVVTMLCLVALLVSACGAEYPSPNKVNGACTNDGGAAFIQQHNPPDSEGEVNFIERCKDNRVIVVQP